MTFSSESEDSETRTAALNFHPKVDPPDNPKVKKRSGHKCKLCGAVFSRPWRLTAHNYVHTGKKPFVCEFQGCDKKYTSSSHLRRHKKTSHPEDEEEVKFVCKYPGCKAEFKHRQNEKRHVRRAHLKETFPCSQCKASFRKHAQLKAHLYTHTGQPQFKCEKCSIGFVRARDFRRHLRGHRSHICPESGCAHITANWSLLRKHMAEVHRKEYSCDYCSKTFGVKSYLRNHILIHVEEMTGKRARRRVKLEALTCNDCRAVIKGKASLRRHLKVIHRPRGPAPKKVEVTKPRAKRKDAGIPKRSMAGVLAAVGDILPKEVHQKLITLDPVGYDVTEDNVKCKENKEFENAVEGILPDSMLQESIKGQLNSEPSETPI